MSIEGRGGKLTVLSQQSSSKRAGLGLCLSTRQQFNKRQGKKGENQKEQEEKLGMDKKKRRENKLLWVREEKSVEHEGKKRDEN